MKPVIYKGNAVDFKVAFYDYAKVREGYRNKVYLDIKGLPTVGIGHLLPAGTPTYFVFTDSDIQNFFNQDYDRLGIDEYVSENPYYTMNQALCIAHWTWMHGAAAYRKSTFRQYMLEIDQDNPYGITCPDEQSMVAYMTANWDRATPALQAVNNKNIHVAYSDTPWQPNF